MLLSEASNQPQVWSQMPMCFSLPQAPPTAGRKHQRSKTVGRPCQLNAILDSFGPNNCNRQTDPLNTMRWCKDCGYVFLACSVLETCYRPRSRLVCEDDEAVVDTSHPWNRNEPNPEKCGSSVENAFLNDNCIFWSGDWQYKAMEGEDYAPSVGNPSLCAIGFLINSY